jgi:hypothetical protein
MDAEYCRDNRSAGLVLAQLNELPQALAPVPRRYNSVTYAPQGAHSPSHSGPTSLCTRRSRIKRVTAPDSSTSCPGTRAEVLLALSGASQRAPLNATATRLALDLFQQVFADVHGDAALPPEPYAGAAAELHAQIQRKLACERDCHER